MTDVFYTNFAFVILFQIVLIMPYDWLDWLVLLGAAASSGLFLTRSFGPIIVQYAPARATVLVSSIGAIPALFVFILKVFFF